MLGHLLRLHEHTQGCLGCVVAVWEGTGCWVEVCALPTLVYLSHVTFSIKAFMAAAFPESLMLQVMLLEESSTDQLRVLNMVWPQQPPSR